MQSGNKELYPIGTDVYDGVLFTTNADVNAQGEVISGGYAVSDFIPVNTAYEYTRSYRLYTVYNYDEHYTYLGKQNGVNDLSSSVISALIAGTKYIRTRIHPVYIKNGYVSQTNCWLKRTA